MKTKPITLVVNGKSHALSAQQAQDLAARLTAAAASQSTHHLARGITEVVLNTAEHAPRPNATGMSGATAFAAAPSGAGPLTDC